MAKDVRQNKGSILRATVEYVRALKEDQRVAREGQEKLRATELQNKKLVRILQVREMGLQCIEWKSFPVLPALSMAYFCNLSLLFRS